MDLVQGPGALGSALLLRKLKGGAEPPIVPVGEAGEGVQADDEVAILGSPMWSG